MKKRRNGLLMSMICVLLCLVLIALNLLLLRPDWRFRLSLAIRKYPAPALTAEAPDTEPEPWSLDRLFTDSRVTLTEDLWLINDLHAIPDGYIPELTGQDGIRMAPQVLEAYTALNDAVERATGKRTYVASAWRDRSEQQAQLDQKGDQIAARPGHSEHELGSALDICVKGYGGMSFLKSDAGRYVNKHCAEYGFIIRYPQGRSDVTGISYEPWHLRYVGQPHATIISDAGLTLEEYIDLLTPDVWFRTETGYILRTASETIPVPCGFTACSASWDQTGYLILTFEM